MILTPSKQILALIHNAVSPEEKQKNAKFDPSIDSMILKTQGMYADHHASEMKLA